MDSSLRKSSRAHMSYRPRVHQQVQPFINFMVDFNTGTRSISRRVHPSSQLDSLPPPINNRLYQESRYKTELCRQYEEMSVCEYGDRCLFAHGIEDLRPLPNRHPKFKTEKCSAYHEYGFCSFGPRCSFIHEKPNPQDVFNNLLKSIPQYILNQVAAQNDSDSLDSISNTSSESDPSEGSAVSERSDSPSFFNEFEFYSDTSVDDFVFNNILGTPCYYYPYSPTSLQSMQQSANIFQNDDRGRLPVFQKICPGDSAD